MVSLPGTRVFVVLLLAVLKLSNGGFMRNKYAVLIENVSGCEGDANNESPLKNLTFQKVNRTHSYVSYDFNLIHPIDENVGGAVSVETWTNGKWVSTPMLPFHKSMCTYFRKLLGNNWIMFVESLHVENPHDCPIPAGLYHPSRYYSNDGINIDFPLWSGKVRFTLMGKRMDTGRVVFCLHHIANIVEKV